MLSEYSESPPPYTTGNAQNLSTNVMIQDEEIINDPVLKMLNTVCLPSRRNRMNASRINGCHIARPERPEYAMAVDQPPNPRWKSVLAHLRDSMQTYGLATYHLSTGPYQLMNIIASILYARECSSKSPIRSYIPYSNHTSHEILLDEIKRTRELPGFRVLLRDTFRHMLRHDYGCPKTVPSPLTGVNHVVMNFVDAVVELSKNFCRYWSGMDINQRDAFSRIITGTAQAVDFSDFGAMLYSIHLYVNNENNYAGMITTLVGETSSMGPEALIRKLSVDYNAMIPTLFTSEPDTENELRQNIKGLAAKFNISLTVPTDNLVLSADTAPGGAEVPRRLSSVFNRIGAKLRGHGPFHA